MNIASENAKVYYPGLDGLRGVAILLVVLYHYFPFFRIGWIGVDLFFVLSGFLITSILLRTKNKKGYFKNFYIRRTLRIFPLYFLFLLLFYIGLQLFFQQLGPRSVYGYYMMNQNWFLTFLQNWLIIKKGPPPEPYLIHFWSLGVEEQFYLVWPLIVFLIKDEKKLQAFLVFLFIAALILRIYLWFSNTMHEDYYYNSFARFDSLAAGSSLALLLYRGQSMSSFIKAVFTMMFLLSLLTAWFVYGSFEHNSFLFATIGYSATALFFTVVCNYCLNHSKLFHFRPLQFIGQISFGIYVYHLPVYLAGSAMLQSFWPTANNSKILTPSICITVTVLVSVISYRILELPFLRLKSKFV